jgi:hypothetical protein
VAAPQASAPLEPGHHLCEDGVHVIRDNETMSSLSINDPNSSGGSPLREHYFKTKGVWKPEAKTVRDKRKKQERMQKKKEDTQKLIADRKNMVETYRAYGNQGLAILMEDGHGEEGGAVATGTTISLVTTPAESRGSSFARAHTQVCIQCKDCFSTLTSPI